MAAFFIATITEIKDPEKLKEYATISKASFEEFGGEIAVRGKFLGVLTDHDIDQKIAAVVKFPDIEAIDNWYTSEVYQNMIPLRNEACNMIITKYEVPTS